MSEQDKYYQEAEQWHDEVVLSLKSQMRNRNIFAVICLLLAGAAVFSVAAMAPMKTVVPYVIEVNKLTGEAQVMKQYTGNVKDITIEEVLSKYWINQYLVARESYYPNIDLEDNYVKVQNLSEGKAFDMYAKRFSEGHRDNPFERYGKNLVQINVHSISFLRSDTASIRYDIIESQPSAEMVTKWVDIVKYKYTKSPANEEQRRANPLGFKITEYRNDQVVID